MEITATLTKELLLPWISATVALFAVVVSCLVFLFNRRREKFALRQSYFRDIRVWADHAADVLTEAVHLCDLDPSMTTGEPFFARRHRLRIELSAMTDKGRFFFPNMKIDEHGRNNDIGYQGYRQEILDGLVIAYRCVGKIDYARRQNNQSIREELVAAKRHFVGQAQKILDPDGQSKEFDKIVGRRPTS